MTASVNATRSLCPAHREVMDAFQKGYPDLKIFLTFGFEISQLQVEPARKAVRQLPPDSQDQIALAMLSLSGNEGEPEEVDPTHLASVLEGLAQAKRRHFATDAEVEAAFRRFER